MSKTVNILGVSAFYHDSAACLVQDGRIVAAAQEERFSRIKHDDSFPERAIRYCLDYAGISTDDLSHVVFYDKPFLKFDRLLETYLAYAPRGLGSFLKAMPLWLRRKLWIKDIMRRQIGYRGRVLFTEHHESHAAAAFFPSPFAEAAIVTVDGVGEWATASFGVGHDNHIELLAEQHFPHSLGLLYSAFTYFCGFKVNSGEYKLMGLAPYGEPKYVQAILDELVDLKEDGSLRVNLEYFDYCAGLCMTSRKFDRFFGGPPRRPEAAITTREMDLARSVQFVTEETMLRMARHVHRETGLSKLCLAGGVALNCVANGRILREGPFADLWIQPAAGDAGGALGAALFVWHQLLGNRRDANEKADHQEASLLGPSFDTDTIGAFLRERQIPCLRLERPQLIESVADLIAEGEVIGWFQGRMEFGPRALGNRSILADARHPEMQRIVNTRIKRRESFRPFAPAVIEENAAEYFDIDRPGPYMLLTAPVASAQRLALSEEDKSRQGLAKLDVIRSRIPAVTHVDYSARLQTVDRDRNPLLYDLLLRLRERHGCAVVINTSFNLRGEPIVCTPDDAWRCFMKCEMDYLVLGDYLVDKTKQRPLPEDHAARDQEH